MIRLALVDGSAPAALDQTALARLRQVTCAIVAENELPAMHEWDALAILGEIPSRPSLIERAIRAGKPVLATGPLAWSVEQVDTLSQMARSVGTQLSVVYAARFRPSIAAVKLALDSDKLGAPVLLRVHRWEQPPHKTADLETLAEELDLARWIFGQLPTSVYAMCRSGTIAGDCLQVHLGFPDGCSALIDIARTLPPGAKYYSLSVIGARGAAYADDHHNAQLAFCGGNAAVLLPGPENIHLLGPLHAFVLSVQEDRKLFPDVAAERALPQLMEAVKESLAAAKPVQLAGGRADVVA